MNTESMGNEFEGQSQENNRQFVSDLKFDKIYPEPADIREIYQNKENLSAKDAADKIYEKYFNPLEQNKPVFFNALMPKSYADRVLRELSDKLSKACKLDKETTDDIKLILSEAGANYSKHELGKDVFPLKMLVGKNKIQFLFGDANLDHVVPESNYKKMDFESESGRGLFIMSDLSDKFEARRNKEGTSYAYFIEKKLF